jgi:predicted RNase H-like HicB family nuclease
MFSDYVARALEAATYEPIEEDGTYWGEIPGFQGVWGVGATIERCRADLKDALEGWLVLGLWDHDETLPVLDGLSLIPQRVELNEKKKNGSTPTSGARKAS